MTFWARSVAVATARKHRAIPSRPILDEIGCFHSTDVVLPLADNRGREIWICCVVRPDKAQAMLLDRLGLRLPERLRAPSLVTEM